MPVARFSGPGQVDSPPARGFPLGERRAISSVSLITLSAIRTIIPRSARSLFVERSLGNFSTEDSESPESGVVSMTYVHGLGSLAGRTCPVMQPILLPPECAGMRIAVQ